MVLAIIHSSVVKSCMIQASFLINLEVKFYLNFKYFTKSRLGIGVLASNAENHIVLCHNIAAEVRDGFL